MMLITLVTIYCMALYNVCMALYTVYWPDGLLRSIASHPHALVHVKSFVKQVHRAVLRFDLHPRETSSRQASWVGGSVHTAT